MRDSDGARKRMMTYNGVPPPPSSAGGLFVSQLKVLIKTGAIVEARTSRLDAVGQLGCI